MGYTHYLNINDRTTAAAALPLVARDLRTLIERRTFAFPLAGPMGTGNPEIENRWIAFNGRAPDGDYESCLLDPQEPNPFTKTGPSRSARRPYDLAVMVSYTLWRWHAEKAVSVDSDGGLADWNPATQLIVRELGYPVDPYFVLRRRFGLYHVHEFALWIEEPVELGLGEQSELLLHLAQLPKILKEPVYAPSGSAAEFLAKRLPPKLELKSIEKIGESDTLPLGARPLSPELPGHYLDG